MNKLKKFRLFMAIILIILMTTSAFSFYLNPEEERKSCEEALDECLLAAFVLFPVFPEIFRAYCYSGYIFCKKYIEN